ncbi:ninein-like protein isoform X3 [Pangasianodon hypophthalmus]|uniref:ninein-like protein isoform X3 n=1 Tax=Pangasianodon hypophthalmus TaxID=310915 RepID=UPI002307C4A5|nr:ninein-like protein isoform X3 [Pangasianodon hypophthalmus]
MDENEQNRYVTQLKEEFDSCDTTGTGFLDKEELTALCHKLRLDAHLPLLLDILLGAQHYARVNFEEFKEGFVAVLSRSLDFSTSEEESSYLEPVPEEVSPKFVKGTKRYGRRSRPDKTTSVLTDETEKDETPSTGVRRAKLRRSTSLESVESLKSDEDTGSNKETSREQQSAIQHSLLFEAQGQLKLWKPDSSGSRKHFTGLCQELTDGQVRAVWKELGVGAGGSLNKQELLLVCDHIGLKDLQSEELDSLFRKLDKDQDGRVSLTEFQSGLFIHGDLPEPKAASTPARLIAQCSFSQDFEERVLRSTSPSVLSATVGQRLLTRLDDGSGCTSPENVITFWNEEGIRNSRDILQTLDFSLEEQLSLADLTLALDNELLVSGNGIHQAALISYKDEIQFLQELANQACQERDKAKAQLELADRRNLQLVREIDDRHATIESLNESKIKDLEQEFREKLSALRSETEQESEVLLQQMEKERDKLREEVKFLKGQEANLQEEAAAAIKENSRLEEEICALKGKLSEAESTVSKLKKDLDHVLQDKYGGLDPNSAGLLSREEHLSGIIKEYELQCRELQDRNDELSSELEVLKNQGSGRKTRQSRDRLSTLTWSGRRALTTESDSDDPEIKRGSSPKIKKCINKNALQSLAPTVSIETELAMEQLKERYEQEIQDLKIQLETKVNFYERTIELMKQNMEVERKEIAQGFKMEISELEEQKALAEERLEQLRQRVERLEGELKIKSEVIAWGPEQEQRVQREQAELEQNYAREIGNIVHRLTSEKDQLEAELKLKMDQEILLVRAKLDEVNSENSALKDRLAVLHQDVMRLEEEVSKKRRKLEEMEREHIKIQEEEERLHKENSKVREEALELSARNLQLSNENAELNSRLQSDQGTVQMLTERLSQVCQEQEEMTTFIKQLQETNGSLEKEKLQLQASRQDEKNLLVRELNEARDKLHHLTEVESVLTSLTLKNQSLQQDKESLMKEAEEQNKKLEKLQECINTLEDQSAQLHSQIYSMCKEKEVHMKEMSTQHMLLKESQNKVLELETRMHEFVKEKEHMQLVHRMQEETAASALEEKLRSVQAQCQELLDKLKDSESKLHAQELELQRLKHESLTLRNKQAELETTKQKAEEQALRANTALSLSQAQHVREVQQLQEQIGLNTQEWLSNLQTKLAEEQSKTQQLEVQLHSQAQQARTQVNLQQEQYEKVMENMQERMDDVEAKLKAVRLMLQEKVNQLKEQLSKNVKSDLLLKDLYVENAELMKALQITEQRQKSAEKKSFLLEEKVSALNKLLRKIAPASLSA